MKNFEEIPKEKKKMAFYISEYVEQLDCFLEKIDILVNDISESCFLRIDLKTEKGKMIAENELKIARVKADVMHDYMRQVYVIKEELLKLSEENYKLIREEMEEKQTEAPV